MDNGRYLKEGLLTGAFNLATAYFFVKKMATPFKKTEAYKLGIIDDKGNILKKMKDLTDEKERKAYTLLDRVIWNIKKLMSFIPGGGSMLAGVAAATALLMKEEMGYNVSDRLVEVMLEAARNPATDEDMIQKISDMWEKSKGNVRRFKQEMKKARLDDRALKKAGLQDFVDELIGGSISEIEPTEQEEGMPTNNVGSGNIAGIKEPFKRKKEMKSESVDEAMMTLFEQDAWLETTLDGVREFCEETGVDLEKLDNDEFLILINALDDFQRRQINEALWMTEAGLIVEDEIHESTAEYTKWLEKIANDRKMKMLTPSERKNLKRLADLMSKEQKEEVVEEEVVEIEEGSDVYKLDNLFKKHKVPAEVMGKQQDDIVIKHKKYGQFEYNPKSDGFAADSKTAKPLMKVWKKHTGENWKDAVLGNRVLGRSMTAMIALMKEGIEDTGTPIFKVSPDVYDQCKWGRDKYQRWNKIVGESNGVQKIIEYGKKNPSAPIIVQNKQSGDMQYLRYGSMSSTLKERYYVEVGSES